MPTRDIAANDAQLSLFEEDGAPALLVSGSHNRLTLYGRLASTGSEPAVVLTGKDNYLLFQFGAKADPIGAVAIRGSDGRDMIVNNRGSIEGDILFGGGNDYFQNNYTSLVGNVYGGDGSDSLGTYEGAVSVTYYGEAGDDFLRGGARADMLDGGADSDNLYGEGGDDNLIGGAGADTLQGDAGNDWLDGGGDAGDRARFAGKLAGFSVSLSGGSGTVTDTDTADGDEGVDTLAGISILRFYDQEVDWRRPRSDFSFDTPGGTLLNNADAYGFRTIELSGQGTLLVNNAEIRSTAVPHSALSPDGYMMAARNGAVLISANDITVENRASGVIVGIDAAIGTSDKRIYEPGGYYYSLAGSNLQVVNAGTIVSTEGTAIQAQNGTTIVRNGATGLIDGSSSGVSVPNGNLTLDNAGTIRGGYTAVDAGYLQLTNTGSIIGVIESGFLLSRIDNRGSIDGGYRIDDGITLINSGQSKGVLDINAYSFGYRAPGGYTHSTIHNSNSFVGDIIIRGEAQYNTAPTAGAAFKAIINNTGTLTGNIISSAILKALPSGAAPDASFVEQITNSGTINGDLRLGAGDDLVINKGMINGRIEAGAGNDGIYFGAVLNGADQVDGGEGTLDQVALQGNYSGLTLGAGNLVGVEQLVLLPGSDTRFGDNSGALYSYNLTTVDANVAAGKQLVVSFNTLRAGENVTFNGAAETDGTFLTYGGFGADVLTGGQKDDGFFFGTGRFGASDKLDGQGGNVDQLGLQGDYAGANRIAFGADQLKNIEFIVALTGSDARFGGSGASFSYDLASHDGNVAAGGVMVVSANTLKTHETLTFNGSAETDGRFQVFSGAGADVIAGGAGADEIVGGGGADRITGGLGGDKLTGGDGADVFAYAGAADSTSLGFDSLIGFDYRVDRIDLPGEVGVFTGIVAAGRLGSESFDADLAAAVDGALQANSAVLFRPTEGSFAGREFLVLDGNGDGIYRAGDDYVLEVVAPAAPINPFSDFFI